VRLCKNKKTLINVNIIGNFNYKSQYGVIVICEDEEAQKQIYDELLKKGYKLKVVCV